MKFDIDKDLGLCGLACTLCSQVDCLGCKLRGCKEGCDCTVYMCVTEKGLDGCYQCEEYPCDEKMLQGIRGKAFNRYAREFGKQALLNRLQVNFDNGISYHKADGLKGDYDCLETEDEIMQLIQTGKHNPYIKCPVFETESFIVRLVSEEDVVDLLTCYSDTNAWPIFNSDTCTSNFVYNTSKEMRDCVKLWIDSYVKKEYIRFSIIDKHSNKAVGTIEMFGTVGKYKTYRGTLRLDIASKYEEPEYLNELFSLCLKEFFNLFSVNQIVTKAMPEATNRISILKKSGFTVYDFPERDNYWEYKRQQIKSI